MATNIADEGIGMIDSAFRKLDFGGIVQDAKDVAFLLFTSKEKKFQIYDDQIFDGLVSHNWLLVANSCIKKNSLMTNFFGNVVGDKRKYCVTQSLKCCAEGLFHNEPHPDLDAICDRAAKLPPDFPLV